MKVCSLNVDVGECNEKRQAYLWNMVPVKNSMKWMLLG